MNKSTKFYMFWQNNSGGYFVNDDNVAPCVVIEAFAEGDAISKLEAIVNQKDEYSSYCPCCGGRWNLEADEVFDSISVPIDKIESFKKKVGTQEAVLYPLKGKQRRIPWIRYGMDEYLE